MSESFHAPAIASNSPWTDEELPRTIEAYLTMLRAELDGEPYNKAKVNRDLRAGPLANRTESSIEFRMQNISAALYELKMPRIAGYRPAMNIGSAVKEKMIALLQKCGIEFLEPFVATADPIALAKNVTVLRKQTLGSRPLGSYQPAMVSTITTSYVRDPAVKAWILQVANGCCEGCDAPAPFMGGDSLPYLEVHHVMPLSSHGSDTTTNAAALCPNCHRRCHSSIDRDEFKLALYQKIPRLIVEVPDRD